ncbi:unnamed protein product [Cochlearia groenlandica]
MHQVNLEAFVSNHKIACETLANDNETRPYNNHNNYAASPPESYFLSKDSQLEWLSDNAFFERKDSQKGNSYLSTNLISSNPNSNPSSQRFLLKKTKASTIIGLPKPQKTCFNEAKQRRNGCKVDKNRVLLKRVGSRVKKDLSLLEPSSPKVSCIGRVRSKRESNRKRGLQRQKSVKEKVNQVNKTGFVASLKAIFRRGCKDQTARGDHASASESRDIRNRLPSKNVEPVLSGLGGMTRFASGRRADLL